MPAPTDVSLSSASDYTPEQLAEVFSAGYEGYWFPIRLDAGAFTRMTEAFDLDLNASRVARAAGSDVGVALLGVRETEGWIGGMGVAQPWRRRGIGRELLLGVLAAARKLGLSRVTLEVLEQNEPARALYAETGFRPVRELEVWSIRGSESAPRELAQRIDVGGAVKRIQAVRLLPEPWQRSDETVSRQRALSEEPVAFGVDDGAALVRSVPAGPTQILQLAAASTEGAMRLLGTLAAEFGGATWINVPADDPARPALVELAAEVVASQSELELLL